MACINRFPGYCTQCGVYVPAGAGVYVKATIRTYCAEHAPDDAFSRLVAEARTVAADPCAGALVSRTRLIPSGYGRVRLG